jgi:hypothetical protein
MRDTATVTAIPLLGALHLRFPRYNAVVVEELLTRAAGDVLAIEPLPPGFAEDPSWRDTEELLVPWVVVPWAERRRLRTVGVFEPSPDPAAASDMARYLGQFESGRATLDRLAAPLRAVEELLAQALPLERVVDEVVPRLAEAQALRLEAFGDGPGTDWSEARADAVAERVLALDAARVTLVVGIDRFASVRAALERRGAAVHVPPSPPPSEAARERALLDLAWRGEGADAGPLVAKLRELAHAEARYHAAHLLLAHGHAAEALEEIEAIMRLEFARPPFLPALVLARLGQLRDLAGRRDDAVRAYRGALAPSWVPAAAREAAERGLREPFGWPEPS